MTSNTSVLSSNMARKPPVKLMMKRCPDMSGSRPVLRLTEHSIREWETAVAAGT